MDNLKNNNIPERIRTWLNGRGISDKVIAANSITYDPATRRIEIPVRDQNGIIAFYKYRRDPEDTDAAGPKYSYSKGAHTALFRRQNLQMSNEIIICEGEFDCLVLESKGFFAVTSTGGALSFQEEWVPLFSGKDLYVCFDNDKAGREGIMRVCRLLPHAKVIPLPLEVGDHGDITDFFTKLGKTEDDLRLIMSVAEPLDIPPEPVERPKRGKRTIDDNELTAAKKVPLSNFIKFDRRGFAICPFHNEKTPSLKRDKQNRWYCYGCGAYGDVIDMVMKLHDLTMKEAIKKILD